MKVSSKLIAGASADNMISYCGISTFLITDSSMGKSWNAGFANILLAGACADGSPARGGALTFNVDRLPWWDGGSAPCWCGC